MLRTSTLDIILNTPWNEYPWICGHVLSKANPLLSESNSPHLAFMFQVNAPLLCQWNWKEDLANKAISSFQYGRTNYLHRFTLKLFLSVNVEIKKSYVTARYVYSIITCLNMI